MTQKTKKLIYNIVIIAILLGGIAVVLAKFLHLGIVLFWRRWLYRIAVGHFSL